MAKIEMAIDDLVRLIAKAVGPLRAHRKCVRCGTVFEVTTNIKKTRRIQAVCSAACRKTDASQALINGYAGGYTDSATGMVHVLTDIPRGRGSTQRDRSCERQYRPLHRVLIEKDIGRSLARSEMVVHLNGDNGDNRLSNLYVFPSLNSLSRYYGRHERWPVASNVDELKAWTLR